MKKILFITAFIFLISTTTVNVKAQNIDTNFSKEFTNIEYLSDGCYIITTITSGIFLGGCHPPNFPFF